MVRVDTKNALHALYDGLVTVYQYMDTFDPITKQTTQSLNAVPNLIDIPCRLSFNTLAQVKYLYETPGVPNQTQITKLFLDVEHIIPAGSVLEVTQNGKTISFKNSGKPAIHSNHQEIILELLEEH